MNTNNNNNNNKQNVSDTNNTNTINVTSLNIKHNKKQSTHTHTHIYTHSHVEELEKEITMLKHSLNNQTQMNLTLQKESMKLLEEIEKYKELYTIVKNSRDILQRQFQQYKDKYIIDSNKINEYNALELKYKDDVISKEKYYKHLIETNENKHSLSVYQYKQQLEVVENKLNEMKVKYNAINNELAQTNEQLVSITNKYDMINNERQTLILVNNQLKQDITKYMNEIQGLKKEMNQKEMYSNLDQNGFEEVIRKLQNEHEEQKCIIESMHREELNHLQFTHNLNFNQTKLKLEETISNLKIELSNTKKELDGFKRSIREFSLLSIRSNNDKSSNNNNNNTKERISRNKNNSQMLSEINTQITNASPEEKKKNKYNKVIFFSPTTPKNKHSSHTINATKSSHLKCNSTGFDFNKKIKSRINQSSFNGSSSTQNIALSNKLTTNNNSQQKELNENAKERGKVTMSSSNLRHRRNYPSLGVNDDLFKSNNNKLIVSSLPKLGSHRTISNSPL
jgi:hypothetical protein